MVYTPLMPELSLALIVSAATLLAVIVLILIVFSMARRQVSHPESLARVLEETAKPSRSASRK